MPINYKNQDEIINLRERGVLMDREQAIRLTKIFIADKLNINQKERKLIGLM